MDSSPIDRFCSQYKQVENPLDYPGPLLLRESATQQVLYQKLFADSALQFAPPLRYQLKMLKELLSRIEASIDDWEEHGVSDDLMSRLSDLLSEPIPDETFTAQQKCYVTYHLSLLKNQTPPAVSEITILESRSLISASGTTGLRTWEAALHLGQYLCLNPLLVKGRRVLELGAGTGYLSILCTKFLGAAQVIASDGSDDVINNLPENFFLNDLQGSTVLTLKYLKWGHALVGTEEKDWNGGCPIDLVLGADITFDARLIPALVATLEELVELFPPVKVFISVPHRKINTFQAFLDQCQRNGFDSALVDFEIQPREKQMGPFYSDTTPILICRLSKSIKQ